jgi:hypothetical protein
MGWFAYLPVLVLLGFQFGVTNSNAFGWRFVARLLMKVSTPMLLVDLAVHTNLA